MMSEDDDTHCESIQVSANYSRYFTYANASEEGQSY